MVVDPGQGGIESVPRGLLVGRACRELTAKLGGVLRRTDDENPLLEDRRECWRDRAEIHEIHSIRSERVAEIGTQPEEYVVVVRVGWPVLVECDCEIDIARRVSRVGGVGAEENCEPDRMLPEYRLEGIEIEASTESGRLSSSYCQKSDVQLI
jgi:hypothetical protein